MNNTFLESTLEIEEPRGGKGLGAWKASEGELPTNGEHPLKTYSNNFYYFKSRKYWNLSVTATSISLTNIMGLQILDPDFQRIHTKFESP